jgi:hypothetical protein
VDACGNAERGILADNPPDRELLCGGGFICSSDSKSDVVSVATLKCDNMSLVASIARFTDGPRGERLSIAPLVSDLNDTEIK